jgi:hypothetical protein
MVAVEVLTSGFGPAEHAPNCPIGTASSEGICTCGASVRLHNDKRLDLEALAPITALLRSAQTENDLIDETAKNGEYDMGT